MSELTTPATAHFDATTMMRYDANKRSTGVAYLIWFFLGGIGIHRFYLRRKGSAVAMLCLGLAASVFYFIAIGVAAGAATSTNGAHGIAGDAADAAANGAYGAAGVLWILGMIAGAIVGVWWLVDAFLIPGMTRDYNNGLITQLSNPGAAATLR